MLFIVVIGILIVVGMKIIFKHFRLLCKYLKVNNKYWKLGMLNVDSLINKNLLKIDKKTSFLITEYYDHISNKLKCN